MLSWWRCLERIRYFMHQQELMVFIIGHKQAGTEKKKGLSFFAGLSRWNHNKEGHPDETPDHPGQPDHSVVCPCLTKSTLVTYLIKHFVTSPIKSTIWVSVFYFIRHLTDHPFLGILWFSAGIFGLTPHPQFYSHIWLVPVGISLTKIVLVYIFIP